MHQWKNFENWLNFSEDVDKKKVGRFLEHSAVVVGVVVAVI